MLHTFTEVWLCDFEFPAPPGERPTPLCLVARELHTGRTLKIWEDELRAMDAPPFACDASTLDAEGRRSTAGLWRPPEPNRASLWT